MKFSRKFIKFLITGSFAAFMNFTSRILFNFVFDYNVSIILAFFVGLFTAYVLFKHFVFTEISNPKHSLVKFVLVNVIAVLQTYFVSVYLNMFLESYAIPFSKEIAHFVGISVPVISSYFGHKYYSFR